MLPKTIPSFKDEFIEDKRKELSGELRTKYPNKVPIIVERAKSCKLPLLEKNRMLIDGAMTIGYLIAAVRAQLKLEKSESMFINIQNKVFPASLTIQSVYQDFADEDGFLYVLYYSENMYGEE